MMNQTSILDNWLNAKSKEKNFYSLENACAQKYEFKGLNWGHPSNYAYIEFQCQPALELSFSSHADWPATLSAEYILRVESAICQGIVDALLSESIHPYRGCSLKLVKVIWDDIMSSEAAFYKATKHAMKELILKGKWQINIAKAI
jgi:hypothetical protein